MKFGIEHAVAGAVIGVAAYRMGVAYERARFRKALIAEPLQDASQIRGLSADEREVVQFLMDQGAQIFTKQVEDVIVVLYRQAGDHLGTALRRLFAVPAEPAPAAVAVELDENNGSVQ